jgi:7-carboxy-7-deazaguanine synthase
MIPLNTQRPEHSVQDPFGSLDVVEVWDTIQGEGPLAGTPAVFIRLAGCNLQCPACDTDYSNGRVVFPVEVLMTQVHCIDSRFPTRGLIVLTGGEPFRQNVGPFIRQAVQDGYAVQIETNGTLAPDDPTSVFPWFADGLTIVCSPKTSTIHYELAPHVDAVKYVVADGYIDTTDGLPLAVLGKVCRVAKPPKHLKNRPERVFIQPQDDQDPVRNEKNLRTAVAICKEFGYRLSVQLHKLVGVA